MIAAIQKEKKIPKKRFIPVGSQVALHVYLIKETEAGVVLPDGSQADYRTPVSLVIAVGPDVKQVKEGDKVLCSPSAVAKKVKHEGDEWIMIEEKELLGVLLTAVG